MKYPCSVIKNITVIQRCFRYKLLLRDYIQNNLTDIYQYIFNIINNINCKFYNNIIDNTEYNNSLTKLETISQKYGEIDINNIKLFDFTKYIFLHYKKKINSILDEIKLLVKNTGTELIDILRLYNINKLDNLKELYYYHTIFIPININIYNINNNNNKPVDKSLVLKDQSLLDIFSNIINKLDSIDNDSIDLEIIKNIKNIVFTKLEDKKNTLILSLFGAKLYIKCKDNVYIISGYFKKDTLNLYRNNHIFLEKTTLLNNSNISIPVSFKKSYIEQITIRDFIVNSVDNLILKCQEAYSELNKLKQKTISSLVKEFLTGNFEKQRNILTLFLLAEDDTDTQYIAYLMYDMISNESYLLKPQPLAEQVFNSLHWSVQKKFKVAMNKVDKYTQSIVDFNESDIPYEKRICLMKASESIKAKAMDKLKEINNRSNDSAVKAQQYLDGLLKIPFGIYIKEEIINYLDEFRKQFDILLNTIDGHNIKLITDIKNKNKATSTDINTIFDLLGNNLTINNIIGYLEKSTIKEYKLIIKHINALNINHNITVSSKNKSILKDEIIGVLNDISTEEILTDISNIIKIKPNINIKLTDTYEKLKHDWCKYQLEKKQYIKSVRNTLNDAIYGHEEPKVQIERIIAQWINGNTSGYCFGFEGPPGTGKTTLAKKGLTKCLADKNGNVRPFAFIPIGGSTNGSTLEGHCYTYVGSTWGRIVDVLMETKCMNPIIFIDELDKISHTEHGKELIGILTHMTDSSQNDEFIDKYFAGVKIDLSQALIIFSYNDPELIDRILLDRIHRIRFKSLTKQEKYHVTFNHLLPEIYSSVGVNESDIIFSKEIIEYIIDNYTYEAGARKLREKLFEIVRELNLRCMCNDDITLPFKVTEDFITKDIFSNRPKITINTISKHPRIGLVNGLYATNAGLGGITVIETFEIPSDNKFSLELTGQQGDVMKESMKVARTVAWNIIPVDIKKKLYKRCETEGNFGFHIHCPEGGTPKDGPSAGGAITLALISLLTKIPIKNTIGITGEIDLNGSIRAIGGLESKVDGAKKAGVKLVLCPRQNDKDVEKIINDKFTPICDDFKIQMVDSIWDILSIALCEHKIKFNNYTLDRM